MRLLILIVAVFLPGWLPAQTLFQNNNAACESEPVLCATGGCDTPEVQTLACRAINRDGTFAGADFDGGGFPDCVALREHNFDSQLPEPVASVLINRGAAAVSCSPGPGDQFNASLDYTMSGLDLVDQISNALAGNLNGGNSDFAGVAISGGVGYAQAMNPGTGFGPDGSAIATVNASGDVAGNNQFGFASAQGERNSALFDCDGDDDLDSVIVVVETSPGPSEFKLNVNRNQGAGLVNIVSTDSYEANVAPNFEDDTALTVGDFDGDGDLDVAAFFDTRSDGVPVLQVAQVCLNNGNCALACPEAPTIDLFDAHPGEDPAPVSVEAGDFDGDGDVDLVFSEPGLAIDGLQYYDNDGTGAFTAGDFVALGTVAPRVLTTGCYNNDNVTDVAVTATLPVGEFAIGLIGVVTSGPGGTLNPLTGLTPGSIGAAGIDTADFDNAGGDDIMMIGTNGQGQRSVFVMMNGLETVSAIAGADQSGDPGVPVAVSGASCSVSPEITDPFSDPARFAVQWTVTASPAGATPGLSGADTLTPAFTGDLAGVYTLQLECRTRCTTRVVDTKNVTLGGVVPTPSPTATPLPLLQTQGGCLASLAPGAGPGNPGAMWVLLGVLPAAFGWLRRRRG